MTRGYRRFVINCSLVEVAFFVSGYYLGMNSSFGDKLWNPDDGIKRSVSLQISTITAPLLYQILCRTMPLEIYLELSPISWTFTVDDFHRVY